MKIRKCHICNIYTIEEECPRCGGKTSSAHYKFVKAPSKYKPGQENSSKSQK